MNARGFSFILIWGSQGVAIQGLLDPGAPSVGVFPVTVFRTKHLALQSSGCADVPNLRGT